jgi:hypothetical protein
MRASLAAGPTHDPQRGRLTGLGLGRCVGGEQAGGTGGDGYTTACHSCRSGLVAAKARRKAHAHNGGEA